MSHFRAQLQSRVSSFVYCPPLEEVVVVVDVEVSVLEVSELEVLLDVLLEELEVSLEVLELVVVAVVELEDAVLVALELVVVASVVVEVVLTVEVEVEVDVTEPPAVTAVCACCPLPVMVSTYLCPKVIPWVGVFPSNNARAPMVIGPW